MRYSIMLQIVVVTTLILVGSGAFFAWLQNRPQLDRFERSQVSYAFFSPVFCPSSISFYDQNP